MVVLAIGLILWFFINRASSRTNEQIELLEALLDQQKRQNALLRRLCEASEPEKTNASAAENQKAAEDDDIIRLRTSIKQAAEVKLENGVISVTDLIRVIKDEDMDWFFFAAF